MDFIAYLKTLEPEDWDRKATGQWTVKDVVAHMVGWEKGDPEAIRKAWETREPPWWMKTDEYDEFNKKNTELYKNHSPAELIAEWEKLREQSQEEIDRIGEENLRTLPELFGWLFEEGEDSHSNHHYRQVRDAVEKN